jgi:hypothetical protein
MRAGFVASNYCNESAFELRKASRVRSQPPPTYGKSDPPATHRHERVSQGLTLALPAERMGMDVPALPPLWVEHQFICLIQYGNAV